MNRRILGEEYAGGCHRPAATKDMVELVGCVIVDRLRSDEWRASGCRENETYERLSHAYSYACCSARLLLCVLQRENLENHQR